MRLIALLPALAWLALWLLSRSPHAYLLSHEFLGERAFSPPVATLLFGAGWLLMVVAMMLPAALPALGRLAPQGAVPAAFIAAFNAAFIAAFLAVWLLFGFAFAFGDLLAHAYLAVHHPRVAALLPAAAVLVAGLWQWLQRYVAVGRGHPPRLTRAASPRAAFLLGWSHGLLCLHSCWALMLAMSAVGHGSLPVMALFAVAMSLARRQTGARVPAARARQRFAP